MLNKNPIDPKAVKILQKYNVLAAGYVARGYPLPPQKQEFVEKHRMSSEDWAYLKEHGLAFEFASVSHDEAVQECFKYYAQCKREHVLNLFLSSLSSSRLDYRSGFPAFVLMQTMPKHGFEPNTASFCTICAGPEKSEHLDLTGLNKDRFTFGSLPTFRTSYEIWFYLQQHVKLEDVEPSEADLSIFRTIIDTLKKADASEKLADIMKKIKAIDGFKINNNQCKCLLETLGFCGILETERHKGYLSHWTNPGLAPSKSHSSNWAYPVDFWTGKDKVNMKALKFWFGTYV